MAEFVIPADRDAKLIADIGFKPAFSLTLLYETPHAYQSPHGERLFKQISGGSISGRLEGTVYPHGAGEYSLRRGDRVTDIDGHVLVRDAKGEWVYIRNKGYARADGYWRVTSWVDADVRGDYSWVLGLFFIGVGRPTANGGLKIDYSEVL